MLRLQISNLKLYDLTAEFKKGIFFLIFHDHLQASSVISGVHKITLSNLRAKTKQPSKSYMRNPQDSNVNTPIKLQRQRVSALPNHTETKTKD